MVVDDWGDARNLWRINRVQRRLIQKEWWLTAANAMTKKGGGWWKHVEGSLYNKRFDLFSNFLLFSSFLLLLYFYSDFHSPLRNFFFWLFVAHQRSSIKSLRRFPLKNIIFHFFSSFFILSQFLICFVCNSNLEFFFFYVHRSCGEGIMPRKRSFNGVHSGAKQHPTYIEGSNLS